MWNVHYQLALTYVPVHLSLYAAEQGAGFLRTQSQMNRRRRQKSAAQLHITPDHQQRLTHSFFVFKRKASNQEITCHFNWSLFPSSSPPRQTPSSFGCSATCV